MIHEDRVSAAGQALGVRPWLAPELVSLHRLPMHSVAHEDRVPLDGTWQFQLLFAPDAAPGPDWARSTSRASGRCRASTTCRTTRTSRCRSRPAAADPASRNPTGVYERTLRAPRRWDGRRVVLHVGAAESVLVVRAQRPRRRHQQGLPPRRRVRHHGVRAARREHARAARREVVGRHVHRGPGPVVARRHHPRRCSCTPREQMHLADVRADAGLGR